MAQRKTSLGAGQANALLIYYSIGMVVFAIYPISCLFSTNLTPSLGALSKISVSSAISVCCLFYIRKVYKTLFNTSEDDDVIARSASLIYFIFRPFFAALTALIVSILSHASLFSKTSSFVLSGSSIYEALLLGIIAGIAVGDAVDMLLRSSSNAIRKLEVFKDG